MVACIFAFFYLFLISFCLTSCSQDFDIDDIIKSFSYESSDSDYDEEVSTIINSFYDFHNSFETQVQSAVQFQCSPIWFNENDSAKNESEDVMKEKEKEKYEIDRSPKVIKNLSARSSEIEKIRPIRCNTVNYRRKSFLKEMLERFRRETGQLKAKAVSWKLLDRSSIPSEYDEVKIGSDSMSRPKYFLNPEIVDNIHFKQYTENQPNLKKCNRNEDAEIDDISSRHLSTGLLFKSIQNVPENSADFAGNIALGTYLPIKDFPETDKSLLRNDRKKYFREKMLERFRKETGQLKAKHINWKLLDRSSLPSKYDGIKIDCISMSRTENFENPDIVDNIHFKPCTKGHSLLKKRKTNAFIDDDNPEVDDSENVLEEQEKSDFNNSPEVIDNLSAGHRLLKRRKYFRKNMLERFREETGQLEAKVINWRLLDRSRIPSEYDGIKIDSILMMKTEYFENPDIVDNIHFKPCTDNQPALKECNSNIDPLEIKMRLLEIFRIDSDRPNAPKIIWDRIDSDRLPEKYIKKTFSARTVYGQKFYEDPEFMENVHFKPYTRSYIEKK
jgi:hypothetical protein